MTIVYAKWWSCADNWACDDDISFILSTHDYRRYVNEQHVYVFIYAHSCKM